MNKIAVLSLSLVLILAAACKREAATTSEQSIEQTPAKEKKNTPANARIAGGLQKMSVSQLEALLRAGADIPIIDVRTPAEIAQGKIAGAIEMDFEAPDFEQKLQDLDRDRSYIVYCAAGGRSNSAGELMVQKGFANVFNLQGGYDAWIKHTAKK